jgi:hypothetical protein
MYDYYEDEPYYNPEDFLEEYEVNLREIITKAVNDKIRKTIDELTLVKSQNEILTKEKNELKNQNRNIERVHKEELDKALKENTKEVERKLSCGFIPYDVIYYVKSDSKITKCEKCDGKGKVTVEVLGKNTKVDCPHCSYGNIYHYNYYPVQDIVSSVYFNYHRIDRNKRDGELVLKVEKIYLDKYDSSMSQESIYRTLEECQLRCDELNKTE